MQFHTKKEGELGLKEQEIIKERNFLIEYSMGRVRTTLLHISLYGNRVRSSYSPAWSSVTNKAQTLPVIKTAAKYVLNLKLLLLSYNTNNYHLQLEAFACNLHLSCTSLISNSLPAGI